MKKFGSLLMSTLLCASLLAGCSSSASVSQSTVPETISTAEGAIETGSEEVSLEEMTAAKTETSTEALEESSDDTVVRVGGLKGPTTMGLVKLMDDAKNGTAANNYEFTMVTAADELTGLVASGKVDIALLPANVASVLYHKTEGKVSVIDINTLGVLSGIRRFFYQLDRKPVRQNRLSARQRHNPGICAPLSDLCIRSFRRCRDPRI